MKQYLAYILFYIIFKTWIFKILNRNLNKVNESSFGVYSNSYSKIFCSNSITIHEATYSSTNNETTSTRLLTLNSIYQTTIKTTTRYIKEVIITNYTSYNQKETFITTSYEPDFWKKIINCYNIEKERKNKFDDCNETEWDKILIYLLGNDNFDKFMIQTKNEKNKNYYNIFLIDLWHLCFKKLKFIKFNINDIGKKDIFYKNVYNILFHDKNNELINYIKFLKNPLGFIILIKKFIKKNIYNFNNEKNNEVSNKINIILNILMINIIEESNKSIQINSWDINYNFKLFSKILLNFIGNNIKNDNIKLDYKIENFLFTYPHYIKIVKTELDILLEKYDNNNKMHTLIFNQKNNQELKNNNIVIEKFNRIVINEPFITFNKNLLIKEDKEFDENLSYYNLENKEIFKNNLKKMYEDLINFLINYKKDYTTALENIVINNEKYKNGIDFKQYLNEIINKEINFNENEKNRRIIYENSLIHIVNYLEQNNIYFENFKEIFKIEYISSDKKVIKDNSSVKDIKDNSSVKVIKNNSSVKVIKDNSLVQNNNPDNSSIQNNNPDNSSVKVIKDISSDQKVIKDNSSDQKVIKDNSSVQKVIKDNSSDQKVIKDNSSDQKVIKDNSSDQKVIKDNSSVQKVIKDNSSDQNNNPNNSSVQKVIKDNSSDQNNNPDNISVQKVIKDNSSVKNNSKLVEYIMNPDPKKELNFDIKLTEIQNILNNKDFIYTSNDFIKKNISVIIFKYCIDNKIKIGNLIKEDTSLIFKIYDNNYQIILNDLQNIIKPDQENSYYKYILVSFIDLKLLPELDKINDFYEKINSQKNKLIETNFISNVIEELKIKNEHTISFLSNFYSYIILEKNPKFFIDSSKSLQDELKSNKKKSEDIIKKEKDKLLELNSEVTNLEKEKKENIKSINNLEKKINEIIEDKQRNDNTIEELNKDNEEHNKKIETLNKLNEENIKKFNTEYDTYIEELTVKLKTLKENYIQLWYDIKDKNKNFSNTIIVNRAHYKQTLENYIKEINETRKNNDAEIKSKKSNLDIIFSENEEIEKNEKDLVDKNVIEKNKIYSLEIEFEKLFKESIDKKNEQNKEIDDLKIEISNLKTEIEKSLKDEVKEKSKIENEKATEINEINSKLNLEWASLNTKNNECEEINLKLTSKLTQLRNNIELIETEIINSGNVIEKNKMIIDNIIKLRNGMEISVRKNIEKINGEKKLNIEIDIKINNKIETLKREIFNFIDKEDQNIIFEQDRKIELNIGGMFGLI